MERRAAYYSLVVVTLLNFLNYIDRYILAAVLPRMQSELSLTNTQAGLLATAFSVCVFHHVPDRRCFRRPPLSHPLDGRGSERLECRHRNDRYHAEFCSTDDREIMRGSRRSSLRHNLTRASIRLFSAISTRPSIRHFLYGDSRRHRQRLPARGVDRASVGLARGLLCGWLTRHHYGTAGGDGSGSAPGRFGRIRILGTGAAQRHTTGFLAKSCIYRDSARVCGIHICSQRSRLLDAGIFGKSSRRDLSSANFIVGSVTVAAGLGGTAAGGYLGDFISSRMKHGQLWVCGMPALRQSYRHGLR